MICTTCEKFDCNCVSKNSVFQTEKQCIFCTYKTWRNQENHEKKNKMRDIIASKWESINNSDQKGVDEVDYGNGDNAISYADLKFKQENDKESDDTEENITRIQHFV